MQTQEQKMTEDEAVMLLIKHLESQGWHIGNNYCLGQTHGIDILATKNNQKLIVEVKGARASDTSPNKKREIFDSGQIKTHFGKALVKILQEKAANPTAKLAIAHPDDEAIRKAIGNIVPFLKGLGIKHYWISTKKIAEE